MIVAPGELVEVALQPLVGHLVAGPRMDGFRYPKNPSTVFVCGEPTTDLPVVCQIKLCAEKCLCS